MIRDVEALIQHFDRKMLEVDLDTFGIDNNGIMGGRLGLIYYFLNMYKIRQDEIYLTKIAALLEKVFENCNDSSSTISKELSFSDGLCGLGFILNELINGEVIDEEYKHQLKVINELAFEYTRQAIEENNFDFFYGAAGSLFYLSDVNQLELCSSIVKQLSKKAPEHDYLYNHDHPDEHNRGVNFGLAHGNPALFMILIDLVKKGVQSEELTTLLNKGVKKLLNREKEEYMEGEDIKTYFPHNIVIENGTERINKSAVLGWCNSELDISLLIHKYLEIERQPGLEKTSIKIALETLKRKNERNTGVYDHHFCHGSSGVAQLYGKLFNHTKMNVFEEAYLFWLNETAVFLEKEKNQEPTLAKLNFLYGWPAALLTLNEYRHKTIKGWDRLFLI